ncbi:MAG: sodium-translocating pyrophosphatase [Candidatus Bathyarchaeota archaeon]|nr:sodium-translocating pyrophosphatase [Candidatus Bathyarchaeota archaeon]
MDLILLTSSVGFLALLVVSYLVWSILKEPVGTPEMKAVADAIEVGAKAFLKRQYRTIAIVAALVCIPLGLFYRDPRVVVSFIIGTTMSLVAAYIGMRVAVKTNVRTTNAARTSGAKAFAVAFRGGGVMGLLVTGLSLIGVSLLMFIYMDPSVIIGFGFGASLAALFAQLGGGIFTKAADIGADLVGKIEKRIPEDDARNPAVIADQVGDNVGDCAGRGSDLFESISDDYITAMLLGSILLIPMGLNAYVYPLMLGAVGILATIVGIFVTRQWGNLKPIMCFNIGLFVAAGISIVGAYAATMLLLGDIRIFYAVVSGLAASLAVGLVVQYYIGINSGPIKKVAAASEYGSALNIITGLSYALQSPFLPYVFILVIILFSYWITGGSLYGLVAANIGTDLAIGMVMSSDAFGPISDNAQGIAEMSGSTTNMEALEELDAMGNTTKAFTKAFATASGTVSTLVIFATYSQLVGMDKVAIGLTNPIIIVGLLVGGVFPFLFSSMAIGATAESAFKIVEEVRRQFREHPGIMEGTEKPDYATCVDIATVEALRQMVAPGLLAIAAPIVVGLLLGKFALGAMLLGGLCTSALLSPFFTFGGGIWDNAKKHIEREFWMKGTPAHEAAVTGDTVGDPLKDVAGPSLNIFMKLTNMTALLIVPLLLLL